MMATTTLIRATGVLTLAAVAAACLLKETTHTLYLEPDGAVTWVALERDVRSDCSEPDQRAAEEAAYLAAASVGSHAMARALARLGPEWVHSRVLRDQRPFVVWTDARFASAADMARELLDWLGAEGEARLWQENDLVHLEVRVLIEEDGSGDEVEGDDDDELQWELADDLDAYRIVLTRGRFVHATGLSITGDVAVPIEPDKAEVEANGGVLVLSLSWKDETGR